MKKDKITSIRINTGVFHKLGSIEITPQKIIDGALRLPMSELSELVKNTEQGEKE